MSNSEFAKKQVNQVLATYKGLKSTIKFVGEKKGTKNGIVTLDGTIPVPIHGVRYNIPVQYNIVPEFPQFPPVALVVPTPDMSIIPTSCVSCDGRYWNKYLQEWSPKTHTLMGLVENMIQAFSKQPPVCRRIDFSERSPSSSSPSLYDPISNQLNKLSIHQNNPLPNLKPLEKKPSMTNQTSKLQSNVNSSHVDVVLTHNLQGLVEKIVKEEYYAMMEKYQNLRIISKKLEAGRIKLNTVFMQMEECEAHLLESLESLDAAIKKLENDTKTINENICSISVDEIVIASSPIDQQILELASKDEAYRELLLNLSQAVSSQTLDYDKYLKTIREIYRQKFVILATMKKIFSMNHKQ